MIPPELDTAGDALPVQVGLGVGPVLAVGVSEDHGGDQVGVVLQHLLGHRVRQLHPLREGHLIHLRKKSGFVLPYRGVRVKEGFKNTILHFSV